jgi:hypothetical protein
MKANEFGLEIIVDGNPLQKYFHEGRTYIAAGQGKEFALSRKHLHANRGTSYLLP